MNLIIKFSFDEALGIQSKWSDWNVKHDTKGDVQSVNKKQREVLL